VSTSGRRRSPNDAATLSGRAAALVATMTADLGARDMRPMFDDQILDEAIHLV